MNSIILAGGKSSRFGENKAFIDINGLPLIEHTFNLLNKIFEKVCISANSHSQYSFFNAPIITDIFKDCGPMGGIHAALKGSSSFETFFAACDMPFLKKEIILYLKDQIGNFDAVVPKFKEKLHPLCAVYTKNCLPKIELQLTNKDYKLTNFIKSINAKIINESEIKHLDKQGKSFTNINTKEEYERIR